MSRITPITVRGTDVPVSVDSDGTFSALYAGQKFEADSVKALRTKLVATTRDLKVAIPITLFDEHDGKFRDGTIIAISARSNRTVIVQWADKPNPSDEYEWQLEDGFLGKLSPSQRRKILKLRQQAKAAERTLETYKRSLQQISRHGAVKLVREKLTQR